MEKIVKNGMRTTGRFALDGSECKVVFSAPYRCFEVKNEGTADIVVSIEKEKAATDSGVIIVAPQTSATLAHMRLNVSTVYITGEGNVQVVGKNEVEAVFKSGMGGGDVTINGVSQTYVDSRDSAVLKAAKDYADEAAEKINAKNAIACDNKPTYADGVITYTKDGVAYSTDDTDTWFYYNDGEELKQTIFVDGEEFTITSAGKVDFTEFVSSSDVTSTYTGNEVDTSKIPDIAALRMLDSKITGNISNHNLIINPDFRINQRGQTEYTGDWIYSVDRWQSFSCKVIPVSDGINLSLTGAEYFSIMQKFENTLPFGQYTISLSINNNIYYGTGTLNEDGFSIYFNQSRIELHSDRLQIYITGETDITLNWVKLEFGSIATPFIPPDPATELVKCQRFYRSVSRGTYVEVCDVSSTHSDIILRLPFESPMRTPPTANILNHNAILTYCNGWIDEPTELTIIGSNITQYGVCYLHIDGFNLTVNGQPLPIRTPMTLATDNVIGLDAEIY